MTTQQSDEQKEFDNLIREIIGDTIKIAGMAEFLNYVSENHIFVAGKGPSCEEVTNLSFSYDVLSDHIKCVSEKIENLR